MSWVWRNGYLVEKGTPEDYAGRPRGPKAALPTPQVISDHLPPGIVSQLDGRRYESRSALLSHYKANGKRIVEGGEIHGWAGDIVRNTRADIRAAKQKVEQGYKPPPLEQAGEGEV